MGSAAAIALAVGVLRSSASSVSEPEIEPDAHFCLLILWSRTMKQSGVTSTDQGGGKRRVSGMARRSWYYRVAVKLIFVIFGILGASAAQAQNAPWCLQTSSLGGYQSCTYATFEQCLVDRAAKNGFCTQNSTYQPGSPAIRRR